MSEPYKILTCQGIGDSIWAAFYMQSIAKAHGRDSVEILVGGWDRTEIECRALPLLRRFPWVSGVKFFEMPQGALGPCLKPGTATDDLGRYRYLDSGKPYFQLRDDIDFVCIPNTHLEYGKRLEDWLPEYDVNWDLFKDFNFPEQGTAEFPAYIVPEIDFSKYADFDMRPGRFLPYPPPTPLTWKLSNSLIAEKNYIVFFLGALGCNHPQGAAGHNHGALWTGEQWAELGDRLIKEMDTEIVIVGAGYDLGYYEQFVRPHIRQAGKWHYRLAEFALMETLAICSQARAVVGYQSGIPIMSHYLKVPKVATWWRPDGNSIVKGANVCFDEGMASSWCYPGAVERKEYLPCIYGRESVDDIVAFVTS